MVQRLTLGFLALVVLIGLLMNYKQYQRDRANSYPDIEEQLDMQYWDNVNGTTKWKTSIAKVKTDNPKPD